MAAQAPHGDVALEIGQQVEQMILQAKQDSEVRVKRDLSVAKSQLQHMEGLINDLSDRVANCVRSADPNLGDPSQIVDRAYLSQKVAHLEQKWGSEVKALKQDLHRTILAHNHNSDLMRIHRDSLDDARKKLDARAQPTTEMFDQQTNKIENTLRNGLSKQRTLDHLAEQMSQLEAQVEDLLGGGAAAASAAGAGYPGMGMSHVGNPSLVAHIQSTAREASGTPPAAAAKPAAKRAAKKDEPPTEEEVRARLLRAAQSAGVTDGDGSGFNVEAPAFVPRGAAAATATPPLGGDASGDEASDAAGADEAEDDDGLEDLANLPPPPGI